MINIFQYKNQKLQKIDQFEEHTWIELVDPTNEEIQKVAKLVGVRQKTILDVLDEEENSRIDAMEDGTVLLVMNVPYLVDQTTKNRYDTIPLGILIPNSNYLVTITLRKNHLFDEFKQEEQKVSESIDKMQFLTRILYKISTLYLTYLNLLNADIDAKEKQLYHTTKNQELVNLLHIEKSLVYFIGSLKANGIVMQKLLQDSVFSLTKMDRNMVKDAIVENNQGIEMAKTYREILTSMTNTYGTIISNNLNDIMKFLAGITIVFSVPTMIASFMGMNVPLGVFETHPFSFFTLLILSLILSFVIAIWLKKKDML